MKLTERVYEFVWQHAPMPVQNWLDARALSGAEKARATEWKQQDTKEDQIFAARQARIDEISATVPTHSAANDGIHLLMQAYYQKSVDAFVKDVMAEQLEREPPKLTLVEPEHNKAWFEAQITAFDMEAGEGSEHFPELAQQNFNDAVGGWISELPNAEQSMATAVAVAHGYQGQDPNGYWSHNTEKNEVEYTTYDDEDGFDWSDENVGPDPVETIDRGSWITLPGGGLEIRNEIGQSAEGWHFMHHVNTGSWENDPSWSLPYPTREAAEEAACSLDRGNGQDQDNSQGHGR